MLSIVQRGFAVAAISAGIASGAFAQAADLAVTKSGPDTANANTDVAYSVTLVNIGPDTAQFVNLNDTIPAGMTFVGATQNSGPAFVCTPVPAMPPVTNVQCSISDFPSGSVAMFTFTFHIPSGTAQGTFFLNMATASAELPPDPDPDNNTGVAGTTVPPPPQADLSVTKTAPPSAAPNTDVTYTITVTNPSPNNGTMFQLQDSPPAGLTSVTLTQVSGPTTSCVGMICTAANFAPGTATYRLIGHIPPGTPSATVFQNNVTITSTNDPNAENNQSSAVVTVSSVDLSIVKSGPATAVAGSNVTYTITVSNFGPDAADNVNFTDPLPAGATFVSLAQNTGPVASCSTPAVGSGGTASCNFAQITSGTSAQFTLVVKAGASTPMNNTASVTTDSFDTNTANNSSTASTTITPSADLGIAKTGPAGAVAGVNITYTIVLTNNGPSDAQTVSVSDAVPANTTFVSFTAPGGWTTSTPAVGGTGTVTASNALLVVGGSVTFTLVVNVNGATTTGTSITNTVTATAATPDPTPNSSSSTAVVGTASADLSVTKTSSPNPPVIPAGNNVTYTITVTNLGPSSAIGVTLTDTFPSNMTFVSATPTQGSCTGTGPVTCSLGNLNSGNTATVTVVTRTGANTPGASTNSATVTSTTPDPNLANNTASATIVAVVPTLSSLLLGLLAAVLAAAALLKLE